MTPAPDAVDSLRKRCQAALVGAGLRVTSQRLEVLVAVASSTEHPDAETVHRAVRERIAGISLDTVYRTLWTLRDRGLIGTLGYPRERFRFDGNMRPHHHFVCTRCGLARDFYSDELDQLQPPDSVSEFGVVEGTHVEVRGICHACAAKAADQPRPHRGER